MKSLIRIATFVAFSFVLFAVASAQDRQIEINANLPAKQGLVTSDITLGGRVFLPVGNFTVVADVAFKDAVNLFLSPTDQINAGGQVWYYITGAPSKDATSVKPFVFGGITRAMFLGEPVDSTTGLAGFGVTIRKPSGFTVIPTFEFNSDDFESDRTVLGREFGAKVHVQIPLGNNFNVNLTPQFAREDNPLIAGGYRSKYSLSVGFSRKF
jgi:hypothetical protein